MLTFDEIHAAAARIRRENPVKGRSMTNREASALNKAERAQLEAWGVPYTVHGSVKGEREEARGRHIWHTARTASGRLCGIWADNITEAHLKLAVGWNEPLRHIEEDGDCTIYNAEKNREKELEKQRTAIERKAERTKAKYTDNKTTTSSLEATVREGMLF